MILSFSLINLFIIAYLSFDLLFLLCVFTDKVKEQQRSYESSCQILCFNFSQIGKQWHYKNRKSIL